MISPTIKQTRTEEDFARQIHTTIQTDYMAGWGIVLDNLNMHCCATPVGYVADLKGVDKKHAGKERRLRHPEISGVSPRVFVRV